MNPQCASVEGVSTRTVTTVEALRSLRPYWEKLHAATGSRNPFVAWSWVWHWWHSFGREHGPVRDRLHVLMQSDPAGTVRGIVPLISTTMGYAPFALRRLRLFGFAADANITEMPAPLVWPGWESASARAFAASVRMRRGQYQWGELNGIELEAPVGAAFAAQAHAAGWSALPSVPYYVLPLPDSWDVLRSRLKRNVKENLRHCYNSLARERHQWAFEAVSEPSMLPGALDEFFQLHRARADAERGPQHSDHFHSSVHQEFLRRVGHDLALEGRFMVCRLRVDGSVVASRIVLLAGDSMYLYYSGFDPAWSRYSVATTIAAECIKLAIERGAQTVNLSTGNDVSKTRWGPEERYLGSLQMIAPTAPVRALQSVLRSLPAAKPALFSRDNPLVKRVGAGLKTRDVALQLP
jgi:CelD/BcsL family acetyltransferase involved in cellulose biosynthesis